MTPDEDPSPWGCALAGVLIFALFYMVLVGEAQSALGQRHFYSWGVQYGN
jgi:hypothetical protein